MAKDKPSKNEDEYFAKRDAELITQTREREQARQAEAERRLHFMKCPKDGYDLTSREHHGVQVEVCARCGGMWLDAGELEQLLQLSDQPGMLRRVVKDVMATLGRKHHDAEEKG
jgi:uncharacterized protein